MIQSMTGYARCECKKDDKLFVAELRSVNHKYCDISVKLPKTLLAFEGMIKKIVQEGFSRGKFDVFIIRNGSDDYKKKFVLDEELVAQYFNILQRLKTRFGLKGEIDINLLASFSDLIKIEAVEEDQGEVVKILKTLLREAMESLKKARKEEGIVLYNDIIKRLKIVVKAINKIERLSKNAPLQHYKRLRERIKNLDVSIKIDPSRLAQEAAIIADRSDITEEIVRFKSHAKQLGKLLKEDKGVGRRLDFLLQEMNREINTLSVKANDAAISIDVVNIKNELEKMREQVQNIE